MSIRKQIYDLIADNDGPMSLRYGRVMTVVILASFVPLCFKETNVALEIIEYVCVTVFIVDYVLRWSVSDIKLGKGTSSFLIYPLTPMALIDLLSILPSFFAINEAFRAARVSRLFRALRAFKLFRFSRGFNAVAGVLERERQPLLVVLAMAGVYILTCALIMYNVEPDTFESFPHAVSWMTLSLTSVGFGSLEPTSTAGHVIAIVSALVGIAIIALPSGIITASLIKDLTDKDGQSGETDEES